MADNSTPLLGLQGTGTWTENTDWIAEKDKQILKIKANGKARMLAMSSMMPKRSIKTKKIEWPVLSPALRGAAIDAGSVFTKANLTTAYTTGGVKGQELFISISSALYDEIIPNHVANLCSSTDHELTCLCYVTSKSQVAGTSTKYQVAVKLLEADDNSTAGTIATANYLTIDSTAYSEKGIWGTGQFHKEEWLYNVTGHWQSAIEYTDDEKIHATVLESPYVQKRNQCLTDNLGVDIENSIWDSTLVTEADNILDAQGQKITRPMGIFDFIRTHGGTNYHANFKTATETAFKGKTFLEQGAQWFSAKLKEVYKYWDQGDYIGLCGLDVIEAINAQAEARGWQAMTPNTKEYGINVRVWTTPWFPQLPLVDMPLWAQGVKSTRLVLTPKRAIEMCTFSPIHWETAPKSGTFNKEIAVAGLTWKFGHPRSYAYFDGFGETNTVS